MASPSRTMAGLALAIAMAASAPAPANDAEEGPDWTTVETAALTTGVDDETGDRVPRVLSPADAERYGEIFGLQEAARWKDADRLLSRLQDRVLVGHVLAERYLHAQYWTPYHELKDWLEAYADHPDAQRIYKLALKRKPANARPPKAPVMPALPMLPEFAGDSADFVAAPGAREPELSLAERRRAAGLRKQFYDHLRKGDAKAAQGLLDRDEVKQLLSGAEYDRAQERLAAVYLAAGQHESAFKWAGSVASRSGLRSPEAHWTAGLAAWRLGRYGEAQRQFEAVARTKGASAWLLSGASFWAGRAALKDQKPQDFNRLMNAAAQQPRTFYGMIALRVLGRPASFSWSTPGLETTFLNRLAESAAGRRALALVQIGRSDGAERELQTLAIGAEGDLARGIVAFAGRAGMPSLSMRLARYLFPDGSFDAAFYPLASWLPADGRRVDRALILALIRQESAFNPRAKSVAGARGLMQLMPGTADFVAANMGRRGIKRDDLFNPTINLELGQRYVEILLDDPQINGDLFMLAAAYNAGPGKLNKWWPKANHQNDPLYFIESIPSRETRNFIERVLANLWIYRDHLGQPAPSLDALAAGEWPVYVAIDRNPLLASRNGQDRR